MTPENVPDDVYGLALDALPGGPEEVISGVTQDEVRTPHRDLGGPVMTNTQRTLYDHERRQHHKAALSTLTWIENRTAEIRQNLETEGESVSIAVGAARNMAGDIAELASYLATLQTLDGWRFLVEDDTVNGGE